MTERLIHAPLAHWARTRGEALALTDGHTTLSFSALHKAVVQQASTLDQNQAAATVWVDSTQSTLAQVVAFLATIASGRCAAVADPDWPDAVHERVVRTCQQASIDAEHDAHEVPLAVLPHSATATPAERLFYIGFTSGSSGMPKGFARTHASWVESFQICLDTFGPDAAACVLAPGRISHSLFLFAMLLGVWSGGGVVVQAQFSAARMIAPLQQGRTPCVVAVPSQLLMLLDLAARRATPPLMHVRLILISGARWMRERTPALQALCPNARIVEFYGASETSFVAWMDALEPAPMCTGLKEVLPLSAPQSKSEHAVGHPFANVEIDIRNTDANGVGQIFVRSPMLFAGYVGAAPDPSAAVRSGDWLSVRDMGYLDAQGLLCLVGRESRMLVTQGKNLFPEEVEAVLCAHPLVARAVVLGLPDPVRGHFVVALMQLHTQLDLSHTAQVAEPHAAAESVAAPKATQTTGGQVLSAARLIAHCRLRLEAYKVPKQFWLCPSWPQTASGKTDVPTLARWLDGALYASASPTEDPPCLHRLF